MKKIGVLCVFALMTVLSGCKIGSNRSEKSENLTGGNVCVPPVFEIEDSYKVTVNADASVYHVFDGKVYCIVAKESDGDWNFFLNSYDKNGVTEEYPIAPLQNKSYVQWCVSKTDGKNTLAILSKTDSGYDVTVIDLEDMESKTISVAKDSIRKTRLSGIVALNGKDYVLQAYEDIFILNSKGKIEEGILYKPEGYSVFAADKGVELMNGQSLYLYDIDTMEITPECYLTDCKISNKHVVDICLSEGKYYVLSEEDGDMTMSVLSLSAVQERKEKIKLLLYQAYYPVFFQDDIDKFNFQSEDYEIILDSDRCDPATRFIKETKPDIVILPSYEALAMPDYARQGYLVNLLPYIDESEKIVSSEINKAMVDAFSYNGKLYGLSERIAFQTPMIYTEADTEGYSVKNAVEIFGKAARERNLESGISCDSYLELLLTGTLNDVVENGHGLNKSLLREMLVNVKEETAGIVKKDLYDSAIYERDKRLLSRSRIEDVVDISTLKDGYNLKPVGYPSVDGEPVYLSLFSEIMCISSFCECPEGAFAFIEYMMTRSELLGNQRGSIYCLSSLNRKGRYPGTESGYTELLPFVTYIEGEEFEIKFTDENEELLQKMSENYVLDSMLFWDVYNVIAEEAAYYFADEKSIDEVMNVIENRVNLILAENG